MATPEYTTTDEKPVAKGGEKQDALAALYWREIERYKRAVSDWYDEGEQIEKVYLDEIGGNNKRLYPLLWANVETLKPAVYAKVPTVICSRRFKDRDVTARIAAELMERATNASIDLYGVDEVFQMVRNDRLLPGRGSAWVRYEAQLEKIEQAVEAKDELGNAVQQKVSYEKLVSEKVCVDYVHWRDFGHNVARTWTDVWLVWRKVYKTYDEVRERFGKEQADRLSYNAKPPAIGVGADTDAPENCCCIYELWDKRRNLTSWMAEGEKRFIESGPPPINFRNGFPCPMPAYATRSSKELIPKPDYRYYKSQAQEINDLTEKIHRLTEWLQVKGFVPNSPSTVADPIEEALRDKGNKELFVPVDSWQDFAERGGAGKLIDWLPIQHIVTALQAAIQAREQLVHDVFQITGISDILRGDTDPNETLGAQQLKAQTGTRRLRNTRDEIARFCRDVAALMAEVIAEKFEPQSIAEITGYTYQPTPEMPQQALLPPGGGVLPLNPAQMGGNVVPMPGVNPMMLQQAAMSPDMNDSDPELSFDDRVISLLRNDKMRTFRIDIETDSTIQADEQLEKQTRAEFLNVVGTYLERAAKLVAEAPPMAEVVRDLMLFVVRGYHAGRGLEETIERAFSQAMKQIQQAQANPQPSPEIIKAQAQIAATNAKTQAEIQRANVKTQAELQLAAQKQQGEMAMEAQKQEADVALQEQKTALDTATKIRQIDANSATAQARQQAEAFLRRLQP